MRLLILVLAICAAAAPARSRADGEVERFTLDNGIRVLLLRVEGVGSVGVELVYTFGLVHDPPAYPRASVLAAQLVQLGATESHAEGAGIGSLSAFHPSSDVEATHTRFGYLVPKDRVGEVLAVERERLTSLRISPQLLRKEAQACDRRASRGPGLPEAAAVATLNQWLRHGRRVVNFQDRLGRISAGSMLRIIEKGYRLDNLVLAMAGDLTVAEARLLVEGELGAVQPRTQPAEAPAVRGAPLGRVRWDLGASVVVVAYEVPQDPAERVSLWGMAPTMFGPMKQQSAGPAIRGGGGAPGSDASPIYFMILAERGDDPVAAAREMAERIEGFMPQVMPGAAMVMLTK